MNPNLLKTITNLSLPQLTTARKNQLQALANYIQIKQDKNAVTNLIFICTHNSRRSHLSQAWAQAMAYYFKIPNLYCYSAGTEATALYHAAADALEASGFTINQLTKNQNPIYAIKYANTAHPIIGFSKELTTDFNPSTNFAAIITCNSANESCPVISGAEQRIALSYEDPKAFDNTTIKAQKYAERSLEIAAELKYLYTLIS